MKKLTHKNLINACIDVLEANSHLTHNNNTGMAITEHKGRQRVIRFGKKGSADILSCSPKGRFCAWEVKIGKDSQSKAQIDYEIDLIKRNGVYHVIGNIDDLIDGLKRWRY